MRLQFIVYTTPAPQGSKVARVIKGRAQMFDASKKLRPFRQSVAEIAMLEARAQFLQLPVAGKHVPVSLTLEFHLERPASIPKKRQVPSVKPDVDKLCRATLDALTGVLFADDGQVTEIRARKVYATGPEFVLVSMEAE